MREYITPNDADVMAESDSKSIQNAVDEAKKTGINKVVIPRINKRTEKGRWDVDKAIIITSNLEIVLDNCYIILHCHCNDLMIYYYLIYFL